MKSRAFRLYYIGTAGQWASMNMQMVARPALIHAITGSGFLLGVAALANAIPSISLSLVGGAIADRMQKKYILLCGMLVAMLTSLAVAYTITIGYLGEANPNSWWVIIVAAAVQGTVGGLMMPSRQSIISEIVGEKEVLNAVSLNSMGLNVFRILAPTAAGFISEAFDYSVVYYACTAMYAMAVVCMFLLPKTAQKFSEGRSAVTDIVEGVRYIRRRKTILLVLVATILLMMCGIPFMQLMPLITDDILHVGDSGMGILFGVSGIGAIVGSLVLATMPSRRRGIIMLVSGILMGLALVGFAFSKSWPLSIFMVVFIGLAQAGNRASGNSLVQNYTEPEYRGRVMSFMMMGIGFSSLGTFFAGILAEIMGVEWAIGGLAILLAAVSAGLLVFTSRLRELE